MIRTKPFARPALAALATLAVLATGTAIATADEGSDERPAVVESEKPVVTAPDASLLAAHNQITGAPVTVSPGGSNAALVACPSGQVPTGGGGQTSAFKIFFTDSYASGSYWVVRGTNTNTVNETIRAFVVCTTP
ncbi:hypothetical protein ACFC58_23900 [Kitasatospora purpeofusca]|uniref:hypothetical protein n=1 Tax=Kitasatospora purpeofusca TaxID=67352 RepID=UPI0035D64F51